MTKLAVDFPLALTARTTPSGILFFGDVYLCGTTVSGIVLPCSYTSESFSVALPSNLL